jgi:glycosyltransferase involved in cell wall biosynthesis
MKRIAALVPNLLGVSPGQRVRIESWAQHLCQAGWSIDFYPFEDARLHQALYKSGSLHIKAARLLDCYQRQLRLVLQEPPCDVLFIFREAALIGPALIERLATRLRVPIIYDVDDPIFVPYRSPTNGWLSLLKFPRKTHAVFRLSDHVITINDLLAAYAARFNASVSVIPNCVDIERYRPALKRNGGAVRLVWIGSQSTMHNLKAVVEPLRRLQRSEKVLLRVVGSEPAPLPGVTTETRLWSAKNEVADLQECDIGLVPLPDHPWYRWKFFFKTVQYMAVGLPVIARRMGSNAEIIQDGVNGFLVETQHEWYDRLLTLVKDRALRQRMGAAARATVVERYSTQTQMPLVVSLFEEVMERSKRNRSKQARGPAG